MLTLAQFQQKNFTLNTQEKRLLKDSVSGDFCVIGPTRPDKAITRGKNANVIRAQFIRWLALGGDDEHPLHAHGIRLEGAWVKNTLDFYGANIGSDLALFDCYIESEPNLRGVRIQGSLILSGSQLPQGLAADRAQITGGVFFRETEQHRFESHGEIRLVGATIGGDLSCSGAHLNAFEGQNALSADRAKIEGSVNLRATAQHRFESYGQIRLLGATIGGNLDCSGAYLNAFKGQAALSADGAEVAATIGINLDCSGALLKAFKGQDVLSADGAEVAGDVILRATAQHRFESHGKIRLLGATIGGNLSCSGAYLNAFQGQDALSADRAKIEGSVFLRAREQHRFESHGEIRLLGATIGGNLDCSGAYLNAFKGQDALSAVGAEIKGNIFFRDGFRSDGSLSFIAMRFNGVFELISSAPTVIDFSNAHGHFLHIQSNAWAEGSQLDGFVYDGFRDTSWNSKAYLGWLKKQLGRDYGNKKIPLAFKPQPWKQLISVLRKMGHDDMASDIAVAFEQRRYEIGKVSGLFPRCSHQLFGWLAGYGYKPLRLLWWMLGVWLFSATMYFCAAYHGIFTPSDPLVFQNAAYEPACRSYNSDGSLREINNAEKDGNTHNWFTCGALLGEYTTFSPIAYSLDVILPLVDLGQEKTWGVYIATPKANGFAEFAHLSFNHAARLLVWFEIIFGWVASLMLVAVLTGLTERDKS